MCGLAWQIYLTAAGAGGAAAATGKQCELKFIWGLTIRKQHRDDKLFGHQAQNLHAQKGMKPLARGVGDRKRERVSDTCQWVVEKLIIFTKVNCTHTHTHTVAHTHTHTCAAMFMHMSKQAATATASKLHSILSSASKLVCL